MDLHSEGIRRGHREKRYYFDEAVYRRWSARGAVTLDMDVFSQISQSFPSLFPVFSHGGKTLSQAATPLISQKIEREEREREREEREFSQRAKAHNNNNNNNNTPCACPGEMGKDRHLKNETGVNMPPINKQSPHNPQKVFSQGGKRQGKDREKTGISKMRRGGRKFPSTLGNIKQGGRKLPSTSGGNTPLPGAIDPEDLIAAPPHQRKCQVCKKRTATLKSRDGHVWICDVCQSMILRDRAREMGMRP